MILYEENAEGTTLFPGLTKQVTTTYGLTKSSVSPYYGTNSIRFELRDTDPMNNNGVRAEVVFPEHTGLDRWYGFALKFDVDDYDYDTDDEVIMQWHQGGGLTPALCFRTKKDKLYLRIMGNIWEDLGTLDKGNWHTYVLHVRHASDSTGIIELWRDAANNKILDRAGQNMYVVSGNTKNPTWKLGIYKSGWNNGDTTLTNKRVLYMDEITLGDGNASYSVVEPQQFT